MLGQSQMIDSTRNRKLWAEDARETGIMAWMNICILDRQTMTLGGGHVPDTTPHRLSKLIGLAARHIDPKIVTKRSVDPMDVNLLDVYGYILHQLLWLMVDRFHILQEITSMINPISIGKRDVFVTFGYNVANAKNMCMEQLPIVTEPQPFHCSHAGAISEILSGSM